MKIEHKEHNITKQHKT